MASIRPNGSGAFEVRVKHRLLAKPVYGTFDTEDVCRACRLHR